VDIDMVDGGRVVPPADVVVDTYAMLTWPDGDGDSYNQTLFVTVLVSSNHEFLLNTLWASLRPGITPEFERSTPFFSIDRDSASVFKT